MRLGRLSAELELTFSYLISGLPLALEGMISALFVHPLSQFLAHLEVRELFLSDLDDQAGLRIPTLVAAVVFHLEATEPPYFHPVSVPKTLTNRVKHDVHHTARVPDRQSLALRHEFDKLTSGHILS